MSDITLYNLKLQAQTIQKSQNISYNQALQNLASKNGFASYQALLAKLEQDYCYDEDELKSIFKTNIFKNRQFLKSSLAKLQNLSSKYNEARYEGNEELMEKYEQIGDKISSTIASIICGNIWHKFTDNQCTSLEGAAFAIYESCDIMTFHNDIDAHEADYLLEINVYGNSLSLGWREYQIQYEDDQKYKEWGDWQEIELKFP